MTVLESALRRDRASKALLLVLVPAVSWMWMVVLANDMHGSMTGASAWMMTAHWDLRHLMLLWAMWAVMMTAMMLPSASPLLLLDAAVARQAAPRSARQHTYAVAVGYLAVWATFSVAATALQRTLAAFLLISPMMEVTGSSVGATMLIIAGVYQLTPMKHACLQTCRTPLNFMMSRWRVGWSNGFQLGLSHGAFCVGCCWALMLVLFVGGVMNLAVIAALTALVAFEKLARFGASGARSSSVLLLGLGVWMLAR